MRKRILMLPALVAALLMISATAARAGTFELKLEDLTNGGVATISDNGSGGISVFSLGVGKFIVTLIANTYFSSATPVELNISNFRVTTTSSTGGDLRATLTRTGASSPYLGSSVVGVGSSLLTRTATGDLTVQSLIGSSAVYDALHTAASSTFNSTSGSVGAGGTFDVSTILNFNFNSNGAMNGTADLQVQNGLVTDVPEPMTLLLFGPGVAGLAVLRRRRRMKAL